MITGKDFCFLPVFLGDKNMELLIFLVSALLPLIILLATLVIDFVRLVGAVEKIADTLSNRLTENGESKPS
jgi:hypothetical protein